MLKSLRDHAQGERLDPGDGFVAVLTVAHHSRQRGHFGEPAAVILAIELNREGHGRYCSIRSTGCLTRRCTRRRRAKINVIRTIVNGAAGERHDVRRSGGMR